MAFEDKDVKQVIIFRKDLLKGEHGIRKGKFGAQCAHASVQALMELFRKEECVSHKQKDTKESSNVHVLNGDDTYYRYSVEFGRDGLLAKWLNGIYTKVVLAVDDEEQLMAVYNHFKELRDTKYALMPVALITDEGLTEFHGKKTVTCLGVGPYLSDVIDSVTKDKFKLGLL